MSELTILLTAENKQKDWNRDLPYIWYELIDGKWIRREVNQYV